jgi:choline dehydrogenase
VPVRLKRFGINRSEMRRDMNNNPIRRAQHQLGAEVKPRYDFIVCGSGSSGSVVARRLSEDADVSVLLLEAGGPDDMPAVTEAYQWLLNLGSERDWNFSSQPSPHVNGRSIPMSMGKVLGGGSTAWYGRKAVARSV